MESTDSSSGSQQPRLPPGFRFHPTDEELVVHYLKKKTSSAPLPVAIIAEVDLYKFDPWELPGKATFGDQEWYFFSPRDRKYPNGARPNRAATSGYWKATGTDKPIMSSSGGNQKIGVKKALVFYGGKPPKGIKTNWIMHEYRLINDGNQSSTSSTIASRTIAPPNISNKKNSLRLDDWVLCRIYKKHNSTQPRSILEHECNREEQILGGHATVSQQLNMPTKHINNCELLLENNENFFEGMLNEGMTSTTSLSQLVSCNNSNKPELSMATAAAGATATTTATTKRSLQTPYWTNEEGLTNTNNSSSNKKLFQADLNSGGGSATVANFLNHIPQGPSFNGQHLLLGSLGDGSSANVLRQPFQISGINWSS